MFNSSELERQQEEQKAFEETLELTCMMDFVRQQTDDPEATPEDTARYFEKFNTQPIDEDVLCWAIFRKQYLQSAREMLNQ